MLNDAAGKPMFAWDSRGHAFRTEYDPLHRPTGSFVKGADPFDAAKVMQFEKLIYGDTPDNGLLDIPANDQTRKLNLRGKPYKHYDTAGLVTSVGHNPATGADEAFDFKGNPLRSTRQLLSDYKTTPDWSQNPAPALQAETFAGSARYDALNRPIQLIAPRSDQAGTKFNLTRPGYNAAGLLERVDVWLEQAAEPNALLNPDTATLKTVTNIDYDAKGQRTLIQYGNGAETRYRYDEQSFRLIHLYTRRGAVFNEDCGNPPPPPRSAAPQEPPAGIPCGVQNLHYTYDPVGNIAAIRDDAQQTAFFDNSSIAPSNAYGYDALYRLIHAEGREHAAQNNTQRDAGKFEPILGHPFPNSPEALQRYREDYEYDPVGNILGLLHTGGGAQRWNRRYQYAPDSNRLLATRLPGEPDNLADYTAVPGYGARYGYDPHGNMTSMPHLPEMAWNFKDQLIASQQQVNNGVAGEKTWYAYDSSGQRIRKITEKQNGTPNDERIYLGGYELYRKYNGNGQTVTLERETLHVMDDKQRIALIETRTSPQGADPVPRQFVRFQLGNHLGSAALELDDQARVISYEEFHPYGSTAYEAARNQTETPKRYRYTGKERDEETGLSYHGARYYAPWIGRWISCDPKGVSAGINLFAYVSQNPIRLIDPNGTDEEHPSPALFNREQILEIMRHSRDLPGFLTKLGFGPMTSPEYLANYFNSKGVTIDDFERIDEARLDRTPQKVMDEVLVPHDYQENRMVSMAVVGSSQDVARRKAAGQEQTRQIVLQGFTAALGVQKGSASDAALANVVVDNPGGVVGTTGRTPTVSAPDNVPAPASPSTASTAPTAPKTPATRLGNREIARAPEQHNDLVTRDKTGRLISVTGVLEKEHIGTGTVTTSDARAAAQREGTFDAGHARAAALGGLGEESTTFPQLPGLNRGQFRMFEKRLRGLVRDQGPADTIIFSVQLKYSGNTNVPSEIVYNVRINGATVRGQFFNDRNEMHFIVNSPRGK
jgi:RHS repeat-associated protein